MTRPLLLAAPLLALAGVAGAGTGLVLRHDPPPVIEEPAATPAPAQPSLVVVDVAGAVVRPGVVRLQQGARVIEAIAAAGGTKPDADPSALNKAEVLRDGQRVYVPRSGEVVVPMGGSDGAGIVHINSASERDLESLPGIGPVTAAKIIRSRAQKPFSRVEDLQTRGLVNARVFADIKGLVTTR